MRSVAIGLGAAVLLTGGAAADPMLADFDYGWPVARQAVRTQGQDLGHFLGCCREGGHPGRAAYQRRDLPPRAAA